jgi:membrane-anchored protein YejM (alkaline phosphatase superfamily)
MSEEKRISHSVPSIRATVRRSEKDPDRDAWITMELSAERNVHHIDPNQDILDVGGLARELDMELRKLMSDSNERMVDETAAIVCSEHGEEYTRYEKDGDIWWSHQLDSGMWCKRTKTTGA